MSATMTELPTREEVLAGRVRLTVEEYAFLESLGYNSTGKKLELLDGYVREKPVSDPIHDRAVYRLDRCLLQVIPMAWNCRPQLSLRLAASVLLPDNAVVRADPDDYGDRHPTGDDTGLVAEVSNTTLHSDRSVKLPLYALAGIPFYWIVNVVDRWIEVYSDPVGDTYARRIDYLPDEAVPLFLDGVHVADIPVNAVIV